MLLLGAATMGEVPGTPTFLGNDGDWNHVIDLWPSLSDLYRMTTVRETSVPDDPPQTPPRDFRGCDGSGNHVHEFWAYQVQGLYTPIAAPPDEDSPD